MEGGLGNQLLQYLFGVSLAKLHSKEVFFDVTEYEKKRGIRHLVTDELELPGNFISCEYTFDAQNKSVCLKRVKSHRGKLGVKARYGLRTRIPLLAELACGSLHDYKATDSGYFCGYWVSYEYWHEPVKLSNWLNEHLDRIAARRAPSLRAQELVDTNSCAIHIRRGDYLNPEHINWHGVCSDKYFQSAIEATTANHYVCFSDDKQYIDTKLSSVANCINGSDLIANEIDEFLLMRRFKNLIISNSTYSYLAGLLSSFTHVGSKVVAPQPWYQWGNAAPLLPAEWTRLNATTGIDGHLTQQLAHNLTLDVLLHGCLTPDGTHAAIGDIFRQSKRVNQIFIYRSELDEHQVNDLIDDLKKYGQQVTVLRAHGFDAFLSKATCMSDADFIATRHTSENWSIDKLKEDAYLALQMQANVVLSTGSYIADNEANLVPQNVIAVVSDRSSLLRRISLGLLFNYGSVFYRRTTIDSNSTNPFYTLALSDHKIVIQTKNLFACNQTAKQSILTQIDASFVRHIELRLTRDENVSHDLKNAALLLADEINKLRKSSVAESQSYQSKLAKYHLEYRVLFIKLTVLVRNSFKKIISKNFNGK
jgi:hypothetical protein